MQEFNFVMPQTLNELMIALDETGGRLVAGGTDIIPRMRRGLFSAATLVDASRIDELRFIDEQEGRIRIGALVTHQEMVNSALLKSAAPSLVQAGETVGCIQTRNRGTLGGNIANASPAADTIPPLLTLNAEVRLVHRHGERLIPLAEFLVSPGRTDLAPGELIHSVIFERLLGAWGASYLKLGKRNGMAISVVNAAVVLVLDSAGSIQDARLALGSVAPTVVRSSSAEEMLIGQEPTPKILNQAAEASAEDISPISDVRSTKEYRLHSAVVLARRVLTEAVAQAEGKLA